MIQETVPSAKEYPISFDLGPISNICASSLRKMQKNTNTIILYLYLGLELTSKMCKKKHNLKMVFGWVQLEEKFDP